MTKVAALLPLLAGGTGMAIGAGLLGGGTLLDMYGQKKHQKRQDLANQQWLDYQKKKTQQFDLREKENRERAQMALDENLAGSTQDARENVIDNESTRLADEFTAGLPDIAGELTAGAQAPGTSKVFDDAFASSLSDATSSARRRLQALAKATAYGGGSMGGMGMTDALRGQDAATDIGGINTNRRGDIGTLGRYQSVSPEILEYEQSPIVPISQIAGQFLLGGGGNALGGMFGPGSPTGTGLSLPPPNATGGLSFMSPNAPRGLSFPPPNASGGLSFMTPGMPPLWPEQPTYRFG